jgi:RNA polymerase sigma-70 factor (ECF subfamily)
MGADPEAVIVNLSELAAAALPGIQVSREAFARYLQTSAAGRELVTESAAHSSSDTADRAAELWLACAIAGGDAQAIRLFDDRYVAPLARTLGRMSLAPSELDEVKQLVREKLLVRDAGGHARIEEYAGRGKLVGLVQVIATREALTLLRRAKRDFLATDEDLAAPIVGAADPGLEMLKGRTRDAFRVAFSAAVGGLTPRQRNMLRMHLLGGVTLEQLASIHRVHRATIVRWLREAREDVLAATKRALTVSLRVDGDEIESLMQLVGSQLDASLERLFMTRGDPCEDDPQ